MFRQDLKVWEKFNKLLKIIKRFLVTDIFYNFGSFVKVVVRLHSAPHVFIRDGVGQSDPQDTGCRQNMWTITILSIQRLGYETHNGGLAL